MAFCDVGHSLYSHQDLSLAPHLMTGRTKNLTRPNIRTILGAFTRSFSILFTTITKVLNLCLAARSSSTNSAALFSFGTRYLSTSSCEFAAKGTRPSFYQTFPPKPLGAQGGMRWLPTGGVRDPRQRGSGMYAFLFAEPPASASSLPSFTY
jgi:hypothetical protein